MNIIRKMKYCAVIYVAGAFLTGAWHWNHVADHSAFTAEMDATFAGLIWPFYWLGIAALWVTQ